MAPGPHLVRGLGPRGNTIAGQLGQSLRKVLLIDRSAAWRGQQRQDVWRPRGNAGDDVGEAGGRGLIEHQRKRIGAPQRHPWPHPP